MFPCIKRSFAPIALLPLLFVAFATQAQVIDEGSDASALLASAKVVPAGTTQITGDLTNTATDADVDVYQIEVLADGPFTIEAIAVIEDEPDMNLIVFNSAGQGLAGDDDNGESCSVLTSLNGLDSCLTLNLTAGTYYFAVGDNNIGAFESIADYEAGSNDFIDNDFGILGSPTTEIAVIAGTENGPDPTEEEGDYIINFSTATGGVLADPGVNGGSAEPIPTMGIWGIGILSGLITLLALRQRKKVMK